MTPLDCLTSKIEVGKHSLQLFFTSYTALKSL